MDMNKDNTNSKSGLKLRSVLKKSTLLLGSIILASNVTYAAEQPLDRIAAVVNSDIVMLSSVLQEAKRMKAATPQAEDKVLIKAALEKLVLIKVQTQKGRELGIIVDDVMLNRTVESIAKQNNLTLEKFRQALSNEGFEYGAFREDIRNKLVIDALKQRQSGQSAQEISEQAINDLIFSEAASINQNAQYHLQDILIPAANGTPLPQFNAARKQAEQYRRQLLGQEKFVVGNLKTTDLGWKSNNELPLAYSRALSLMGVGEVSPVVHDTKGFHILKLVEKRGGAQQLQLQVRARHILIGDPSAKGKQKALALHKKLAAGANFATLAKTNSADPGSAINGGDLGWSSPDTYVPAFAATVRSAPIKAISQPVQSKFGWHIIQVLERKKVDASRDALRTSAKSVLAKKKNKDGYDIWLQGVRDDAFIEYRLKL